MAASIWLLLLALTFWQTLASPLLYTGSGTQDKSSVQFHLVANSDISKRVVSEGLVCEFSCRAYGSHQEIWTLEIKNGLEGPDGDRMASCTATSEHHDGDGHKNGMRGFHLKIYPENGVPELEVVLAEAWNDGVNLLRGDEFEVFDTVLRSTPTWSRQVSSARIVVAGIGKQ